MDQVGKKKLIAVKKLLQQKKYQQALQDLQIMVYKYSKIKQVHVCLGFAYHKLNKLQEAQKSYLWVLDIAPNESNAIKQLCQIYSKMGNLKKSTQYLQASAQLLSKQGGIKYKETIIKLVQMYQKDLNMEKIDKNFQLYCSRQQKIGQDFVRLARAYFKVGVQNRCFFLQKWQIMGIFGQHQRLIEPSARQGMDNLLLDVINYIYAVSKQYQISKKQIANTIWQLKMYFSYCPSLLMVSMFDQYCIGHQAFSSLIMGEIYQLCKAYFDDQLNSYHMLNLHNPQVFAVCMLLTLQYLSFFKQFFILQPLLAPYLTKLLNIKEQLQNTNIRQDYRKKIKHFLLRQCRQLRQACKYQDINYRLQQIKNRILSLQGSYLQQVIAKVAINALTSYQKINDMKNLLKLRINNLNSDEPVPHLYKYYYQYIMKIAKVYKSLDQEIPLQNILLYIQKNDPQDYPYVMQKIWIDFSLELRNNENIVQLSKQAIQKLTNIIQKMHGSNKSLALRRLIIFKIFSKQISIQNDIQQLLTNERTFQNLLCAANYYYKNNKPDQCLSLLKQAFIINQKNYHCNRLILLCMYIKKQYKAAISFINRIYQGYRGVFWVNYLLGVSKINHNKWQQAQNYIKIAIQAFQSGVQGFEFMFQKVKKAGEFSIPILLKQNNYELISDQFVINEQTIFSKLGLLSNLYFKQNINKIRLNLYLKQAELLKINGKTNSAHNYISQACKYGQKIQQYCIELIIAYKELATILFYLGNYQQADQTIIKINNIFNAKNQLQFKIDQQIQSLTFQVSVQRVAYMLKFQSFQTTQHYIHQLKKRIRKPCNPSLTYLKNQYQLYLLEYLHNKRVYQIKANFQQVQSSIKQFLLYFKLEFNNKNQQSFAIQVQQLTKQQKRSVRQCLEDYYISLSMITPIDQSQLLQMVSLFPKSANLYVLLGAFSSDVKIKTACFLRVIQLDKESTVSIDILASLYLKQKNYLAAARLFMKSLQKDVLHTKCYIGLAVCLFCLILQASADKNPQQIQICQKAMIRINSYMQFLRLNDPSQKYQLLSFIKLLLDQQRVNVFETKTILQSAQKHCSRYRQQLIGSLLTQTTKIWKQKPWSINQQQIINQFIETKFKVITNHSSFALGIRDLVQHKLCQFDKLNLSGDNSLRYLQRQLQLIGFGLNLYLKQNKHNWNIIQKYLKILHQIQQKLNKIGIISSSLDSLKYKIKKYLIQCSLIAGWNQELFSKVKQIFTQIHYFNHLITHYNSIPNKYKSITTNILLHPHNQKIREIHQGYLIGQKGVNIRKTKINYKMEIVNQNNLDSSKKQSLYTKLTILDRNIEGALLNIENRWADSSLRDIQNINKNYKILKCLHNKCNNERLKQKISYMIAQIQAFLFVQYQQQIAQTKQNKQFILLFRILKQIYSNQHPIKLLKQLKCNSQNDKLSWLIYSSLIANISKYYLVSSPYINKLIQTITKVQQQYKGLLYSSIYLMQLKLNPQKQQEIIQQIKKLNQLAINSQTYVSPSTASIMQCSRMASSGSWGELEEMLVQTSGKIKIVSYSDQILINFFELINLARSLQQNPNGEGVLQAFNYISLSLLQMVKQPKMKAQILLMRGIILGNSKQYLHRDIKLATLLCPNMTKQILKR